MANKTIKFYGIGYAPTGQSASITATINGSSVYSGAIPTVPTTDPVTDPSGYEVLFTYDVDDAFVGTLPMSITTTAGEAITAAHITINSAAEPATFQNMGTYLDGESRGNVEIDGNPQSKGALGEILTGTWSWNVPLNSELTCDIKVVVPNFTPPV